MRAPTRRIRTLGWLDSVAASGGDIRVDGWVVAFDGTPVTRLDLAVANRAVPDLDVQIGLPSPDVAAAHPNIRSADRARFSVVAHDTDANALWDALVAITPVLGDVEGSIIYRLPDRRLPTPSEQDILAVGGGFEEVALEFLGLFVQLAGLEPADSVLDVGCGIGRMAYALAYYLDDKGRYEGFDIMRRLIDWASASITPQRPAFKFRWVDIYNPHYNPGGKLTSETFTFPYEAESFDLVFLTSVFTHLRGAEVRHYLDEIARTLKPGGVCAATSFLLDGEARNLIKRGSSTQRITHCIEDFYTTSVQMPQVCIGYPPETLFGWMAERGLAPVSTHPGSWCGRSDFTTYQDLVIARKDASAGAISARRGGRESRLRRLLHRFMETRRR